VHFLIDLDMNAFLVTDLRVLLPAAIFNHMQQRKAALLNTGMIEADAVTR